MKLYLIFLGLFCLPILGLNHITTDVQEQEVEAIFDAYEGEMYFFTDSKSQEPLTLRVKEKDLVEKFRLPEAEQIGETFKLDIEKEGAELYIHALEKL